MPLLALLVSYPVTGTDSDTNLIGAQVKGNRVIADVGGNLNIESLQDTSTYNSKQKNAGFSLSLSPTGIPVGGSINGGRSKINSDYQSVNEQAGIFAGDGGFDVNVAGNTDLKGAVIASTDKAVQDNNNRLTTATLTSSDIENKAEYKADSVSLGLGYSFNGNGVGTNQKGGATAGGDQTPGRMNFGVRPYI